MRGSGSSCNTGSDARMASTAGFRITVWPAMTPRKSAGYIGSCMDVTELINKDSALREFEERVLSQPKRRISEYGRWTAVTNEMWMSDSARALFQFDSETPVNHAALQDRVHPEDRELRDSAVKAAIETHGEYKIEYRVLLPDGAMRWMGASARCVPGKTARAPGSLVFP